MKFKVEAFWQDAGDVFRIDSEWVTADTHLDACATVLLARPNANWLDPILVVDTNYLIGSYTADCVKNHGDFMVGLRTL